MLPVHTPAVSRALAMSRLIAQLLGAGAVEPLHLLGGLLREEEGRAAALLIWAGLGLEDFRNAYPELTGMEEVPTVESTFPLGSEVEQVLMSARDLATEYSEDRTIASEHLLWAFLQAQANIRDRLVTLGLDLDRLESAFERMKGPPLELDEPLELGDATERIAVSRIVDAAANRAREALRVIEDHCRFALDDQFLAMELKQIRHDLTDALCSLSGRALIEARDTLRDVGTQIALETEQRRHTPMGVLQANFKRLQEALRSLEEYCKLLDPMIARLLEQLRYRSYTLERASLIGAESRQRLEDARLYVLLTRSLCAASLDWTIQEAAAGGATMFQLREKDLSDRELLLLARGVRRWTRKAGSLFVMNDRPDIARLVDADGVHLGQDDMPVKEARCILGPGKLIGVSTHDVAQVANAIRDGASYIGVGPTFVSATKDFSALAGLAFVRQVMAMTSLPAFAIGGIRTENLSEAIAAGARRVAVSHAICAAEDPQLTSREMLNLLRPTRGAPHSP